jgi:hypothetical protein
MSETQSRPVGAHLVGSVALGSAEEVFRQVGEILGDRVRRIPDGETGARSQWVGWQASTLGRVASLEQVEPGPHDPPNAKFRPRAGVDASEIDFGALGYSAEAKSSYATFVRLRDAGVVPEAVRFQVSLPTPFAGNRAWIHPSARDVLRPAFDRAMCRALAEMLDEIPQGELAIQWDVCLELGYWERPYAHFDDEDPVDDATQARVVREVAGLADLVPEDVELGYHLCYGDWGHLHFTEPRDAGNLVAIANGLAAGVRRPLHWVHMPVPRDRDDDEYFAPLRDLRLERDTELYLGLVHYTDGVEGTERRIDAARRVIRDFGVATECGMGRRPEHQDIAQLLRIHRDVSDPVR